MIYFDNSATSFIKPKAVAEAVYNAINNLGSPNRGIYTVGLDASRLIYEARSTIAAMFNTTSANLSFTSGATESLNIAISGLINANDHVITTHTEHNSVLRPLYKQGADISFLPCDSEGVVIYDTLDKLLKPNTRAVVVNHISNVTGNIINLDILSQFCKKNSLYFIVDCAQSAGCVPIDASIADVLCFTGHKYLYGPIGTGFIIVKDDVPIKHYKVGGSGNNSFDQEHSLKMPERLEAGTINIHSIAGLLAGVKYINEKTQSKITEKTSHLTKYFIKGLQEVDNIKIFGDFKSLKRGAVVSLLIDNKTADDTAMELSAKYDIATRQGSHCAPLMHKILKTDKTGLVRFSFSYFNTIDEINQGLIALKNMAS